MVRSGQSSSDLLLVWGFIQIQQQLVSCPGSFLMLSSPSIAISLVQDGKTSYERVFNKARSGPLVHFGERVLAHHQAKSFIWGLSLRSIIHCDWDMCHHRNAHHCSWGSGSQNPNSHPFGQRSAVQPCRVQQDRSSSSWITTSLSRTSRRSNRSSGIAQVIHHATTVKDEDPRLQAIRSAFRSHCWACRFNHHGFTSWGSESKTISSINSILITTIDHSSSPWSSDTSGSSDSTSAIRS